LFRRSPLDADLSGVCGRNHDSRGGGVDAYGQVELAFRRDPALHEHLVHHLTVGTGLRRDELPAQQCPGGNFGLSGRVRGTNATGRHAVSGSDLGFDENRLPPEERRRNLRLLRRGGDNSRGACDGVARQELLRIAFQNLHGVDLQHPAALRICPALPLWPIRILRGQPKRHPKTESAFSAETLKGRISSGIMYTKARSEHAMGK
jgi:hypothetical protein